MNYKLKDICTVTSSKRIFAKDYVDSGIPFLRGKEVTDFSKTHTLISEYHIREELYNHIKSKYSVPTKGDLLITAVGTLGSLMLVNNEKFYFKDGNIIWLKDLKPLVLSKYLFYCLSSVKVQNDLENSAIGSTQRAYTIDMIKEYEIDVPSIEDQQHIVNIVRYSICN